MGSNAKIALLQPDGTVEMYASKWGAHNLDLLDGLTPDTTFDDPVERFDSLESWAADGVDYLTDEAAYVVRTDPWEVTAYDVVRFPAERWSEIPDASDNRGLLIEVPEEQWRHFRNLPVFWKDVGEVTISEFRQRIVLAAGPDRLPEWSRRAIDRHHD